MCVEWNNVPIDRKEVSDIMVTPVYASEIISSEFFVKIKNNRFKISLNCGFFSQICRFYFHILQNHYSNGYMLMLMFVFKVF